MSMKYSNYIQLSPNYESVVDLEAEDRHPGLWQEYIVHEDMKRTVEFICQSMEWDDNDKRRSFWIHGAYGTGKSYAAIVLKHLFEDKVANIETFLSKQTLAPLKKRFLKIRNKGELLVAWESGTTGIKSGTHLMMRMEVKIRQKLAERFGEKAYYGQGSLINAAKEAINNKAINWAVIFGDPIYGLSDKYDDLDDFRQSVLDEDLDAIEKVKRVCEDNHIALFSGIVDRFEEWLRDIIAGNNLKDTGIVFIWDEFTGFLRDSGDDNVLQRLSEFCKQKDSPFFMCLIVHRDPTWVNQLGGETYERILHRYHELEFHITESAAYDLIGDSIIPMPGMHTPWEDEKKQLLESISKYKTEFDNLEQNINIFERMSKLCPLHPMTVSMLATVAQNFGASQRTLFKFMKDRDNLSQSVGFNYYIANNSPDDWCWLTADYLWDYFFTRESDVRDFNADAKKVIQHFDNKKEQVSDEYGMHVFKASMLLIAVVSGSNISNLYSKQNTRNRILATKKTLYKLFRGQLDERQIDSYLDGFEQIGVLRLDQQPNGDVRLELPYTGNYDQFDDRLDQTKKKYTRYTLFSKNPSSNSLNGAFSKVMETALWDSTKSTFGRMYIAVCSSEARSFEYRLNEVIAELNKFPYKIGLIVVVVPVQSDFSTFQAQIKKIAAEDTTGRLVVALLKEPCTDEILDRWHRAITHKELSAEESKKSSESQYEGEALAEIAKWVATAAESQIFACFGNTTFNSLYGKSDLIKRIENDVLYTIFPAAPEKIVTANTAFKTGSSSAVYYGLTKNFLEDKKNQQIANVAISLKTIGAWDLDDLNALSNLQGNNVTSVTELAKFIKSEFEQGAKISLDALWASLQSPPFGYYNSLTSAVFLGLALRSFIGDSFNWLDHQNNTNQPTDKNLASMINKMMNGQTLNNYLSSGSAIWQKFKPYAKAVFGLKDTECVSDSETRKYILVRATTIGVPFWSLKYVPADRLGGDDAKATIEKLVDAFVDFTYNISDDQEGVMDTVLTLFNGRGGLKKVMSDTLSDKGAMYAAFKRFVFAQCAELEMLCSALVLADKDLFDIIRSYLQAAINTWREDAVSAKLPELAKELSVVSTLNTALGVTEKCYKDLQKLLNNVLENMRIPGTVIETLPYSWIPAMKMLRRISKTAWVDLSATSDIVDTLQSGAKAAWEMLSQPKIILEAVLDREKATCSEDELNGIYNDLKWSVYETGEQTFYTTLHKSLDKVSYRRNIAEVNRLWLEKSKVKTVRDWCTGNNCPIAWLFDGSDATDIGNIATIQSGANIDGTALQNALLFLQSSNLAVLDDAKVIRDRFFANIGETYRSAFESDGETLYNRLKTNAKVSSDVYLWATRVPAIKTVLNEFLKGKHKEEARSRVSKMPEMELRSDVLKLLEDNPELYSYFLK